MSSFDCYFFQYFFCFSLSLLYFMDLNDMYIRLLEIVPLLTNALLIFPGLFFFPL